MAREEKIISGIAGRYAGALFELAKGDDAIPAVEADLDRFAAMVAESRDLDRLVHSPVFGVEDQARALTALAKSAQLEGTALNFILLAARNRRLFAVLDMIRAYKALAAKERGEIVAEVISAEPLSESHATALRAALKDYAGRDVTLSPTIDPSLIGGLVVAIGGRVIDTSLKTRLSALKIALKEARN